MIKIITYGLFFMLSISMLSMELLNITKTQTINIAIPLILFWIALTMIICKEKVVPLKIIAIIFILIGISILSFSYFNNIEIIYILRSVKLNSFLLFIIFGLLILNENNIKKFFNVVSITYCFFLIILVLQNLNIVSSLSRMQRLFEMKFLFFNLESGNLFISGIAIFLLISIYNLKLNRSAYNVVLTYLSFFLATFVILTSFVRTAYLMLIIIMIYFYVLETKKLKKESKYLLFMCVFVIMFFISDFFSNTIFFERIQYTFQSQNGTQSLDNSSYARILLFKEIVLNLFSSTETFFLGTGFEEFSEFNIYNPFYLDSAHNGFLNIAVKTGVLYTFLVVIITFFSIFTHNKNTIIEKSFMLVLTLLFLITNLTGEGFNYYMINQPFYILLGVYFNEYYKLNWIKR